MRINVSPIKLGLSKLISVVMITGNVLQKTIILKLFKNPSYLPRIREKRLAKRVATAIVMIRERKAG